MHGGAIPNVSVRCCPACYRGTHLVAALVRTKIRGNGNAHRRALYHRHLNRVAHATINGGVGIDGRSSGRRCDIDCCNIMTIVSPRKSNAVIAGNGGKSVICRMLTNGTREIHFHNGFPNRIDIVVRVGFVSGHLQGLVGIGSCSGIVF